MSYYYRVPHSNTAHHIVTALIHPIPWASDPLQHIPELHDAHCFVIGKVRVECN